MPSEYIQIKDGIVEIELSKASVEDIRGWYENADLTAVKRVKIVIDDHYYDKSRSEVKYRTMAAMLAKLPNIEELEFFTARQGHEYDHIVEIILRGCDAGSIKFNNCKVVTSSMTSRFCDMLFNRRLFPRLTEIDFSGDKFEDFSKINEFMNAILLYAEAGEELHMAKIAFCNDFGNSSYITAEHVKKAKSFLLAQPKLHKMIFPEIVLTKFSSVDPEGHREVVAILKERSDMLNRAQQLERLDDLLKEIAKIKKGIAIYEKSIEENSAEDCEDVKEVLAERTAKLRQLTETLMQASAVLELLSAGAKHECGKVLAEVGYVECALPCFVNLIQTENFQWQELAVSNLINLAMGHKIKAKTFAGNAKVDAAVTSKINVANGNVDNNVNSECLYNGNNLPLLTAVAADEKTNDEEQALLMIRLAVLIKGVTEEGKFAQGVAGKALSAYIHGGMPSQELDLPSEVFADPMILMELLAKFSREKVVAERAGKTELRMAGICSGSVNASVLLGKEITDIGTQTEQISGQGHLSLDQGSITLVPLLQILPSRESPVPLLFATRSSNSSNQQEDKLADDVQNIQPNTPVASHLKQVP